MRAIDTNVLVRLLTPDDPKQTVTAEDFIRTGAWVSPVVLAESIWVLRSVYGLSRADQIEILEMLMKHESLTLGDSETVAAAVTLFRARPRLSFSDCLMVETAKRAGHFPLGTFDRALAAAPSAQLL